MTTVLLVIHLLLAIALIGTVLLQRSEGGGLGIGGGGGNSNSIIDRLPQGQSEPAPIQGAPAESDQPTVPVQ